MQKSIVSLGLRERGRGDYKRDVGPGASPLPKRRLVLRLPRGTSDIWGRRLFLTIIRQRLPFRS